MSPLIIYPPSVTMTEKEFHIYNMTMTRLLTIPVVTLLALEEVVAETVVEAVVVVIQVANMLVKLVISLKPYLMTVKCQNPILCLLSMTCEMGNCSSRKKDLQHYQIPGYLLIVVLQSISFCPQAYYMGYIKLLTQYRFAAMLG